MLDRVVKIVDRNIIWRQYFLDSDTGIKESTPESVSESMSWNRVLGIDTDFNKNANFWSKEIAIFPGKDSKINSNYPNFRTIKNPWNHVESRLTTWI